MRDRPVKSIYDVAIIGAGIGGLTAAALLAKAGMSVCVLEKEPHVGGYLAGFRRRDFRFDTAVHWLNQCGTEGLVNKIFEFLGYDHPVAIPQKSIRRYKGNKFDYLLTNDPDEFKEKLISAFPNEKKGIERFFRSSKKIGQSLSHFSRIFRTQETMSFLERLKYRIRLLQFAFPFIRFISYSGEKGLYNGLNRFFRNREIHKIFASETELISCMIPIGWAYYGDFQSPPVGGGQVIPEWLEKTSEYYGAEIFCSCKVKRILTEGNICKGLRFERRGHESEISAKYVIAASDVETLYEKMLPPEMIPVKLKNRLKDAELYHSSVTISIALDCPTEALGFGEEMIHLSEEDIPFGEHANGDPQTSEISILAPSGRDKSLAPKGMGTLTLYMPAKIDFRNEWYTEKDSEGNYIRGAAYRKLKNEIADQIIERVEEKIAPGLRSHILFYEVSTPVTHWRYTGNRNGTIMGAKPGRKNMSNGIAHYQTPVRNLILGGHWAELGGGVPIATKAGSNAALIILKKENKHSFKLMAAYMEDKITLDYLNRQPCFKSYGGQWRPSPTPAQKKASLSLSE